MISLLDLPKKCDIDHFPTFVSAVLSEYFLWLSTEGRNLPVDSYSLLPHVKQLSKSISDSINVYYSGSIIDAYNILEVGLKDAKDFLISEITPLYDKNQSFYRIRFGNSIAYSPENMFHIPFELRENAHQGRYSIAGIPCLYLADSVYTCWLELNKPPIEKCQISRFELVKSDFKFIDFSWYPKRFFTIISSNLAYAKKQGDIQYFKQRLRSYLVTWPLLFACSVIAKEENTPFKPQYIISQLLMQWVKKYEGVDGIKYFSSKMPLSEAEINSTFNNLALPVKTNKAKGLCDELSKEFKATEAINLENILKREPRFKTKFDPRAAFQSITSTGVAISKIGKGEEREAYITTIFGKLEIELSKMKPMSLKM